MPESRRQSGFTLIELLITLIVFGIIVTVGVPNLQNYIVQNRVKTGAQALFNAMTYARSEAIKRDTAVTIIPQDSGNWEQGWVVSIEGKDYSSCQSDQTDCLTFQQPLPDLDIATAASEVRYQGNGRADVAVSFGVCDEDLSADVTKREVSTTLTGQPSIGYNGSCS